MKTHNITPSVERNAFFQLFSSSPKTVEEQFLLKYFTPIMFDEVRAFMSFFTKEDDRRITECTDPKSLLYTVAEII